MSDFGDVYQLMDPNHDTNLPDPYTMSDRSAYSYFHPDQDYITNAASLISDQEDGVPDTNFKRPPRHVHNQAASSKYELYFETAARSEPPYEDLDMLQHVPSVTADRSRSQASVTRYLPSFIVPTSQADCFVEASILSTAMTSISIPVGTHSQTRGLT
jgi:hypothetical protein